MVKIEVHDRLKVTLHSPIGHQHTVIVSGNEDERGRVTAWFGWGGYAAASMESARAHFGMMSEALKVAEKMERERGYTRDA